MTSISSLIISSLDVGDILQRLQSSLGLGTLEHVKQGVFAVAVAAAVEVSLISCSLVLVLV